MRNKRGTDNLYIIKEISEDAEKRKKELYCVFLHKEKAYDTVNREIM